MIAWRVRSPQVIVVGILVIRINRRTAGRVATDGVDLCLKVQMWGAIAVRTRTQPRAAGVALVSHQLARRHNWPVGDCDAEEVEVAGETPAAMVDDDVVTGAIRTWLKVCIECMAPKRSDHVLATRRPVAEQVMGTLVARVAPE